MEMEEILADLQLLEEADQLCLEAAQSLASNAWLTKQIDDGQFNLENFRLYNARMGGAKLEPQEKCRSLEEALQRLSKTSLGLLDDGSTVDEIYRHLQTEMYRHVWRYHLCMCKDGAKPYFDRLPAVVGEGQIQPIPFDKKIMCKSVPSRKCSTDVLQNCSTSALVKDLSAIYDLRTFVISVDGFALHDAKNEFASHAQLVHTFRNIFDSFDPFIVSRAFSVPDEVCAKVQKNLMAVHRNQHLLLAGILQTLSEEAAAALRSGRTFEDVEGEWNAEIARRNFELAHFN